MEKEATEIIKQERPEASASPIFVETEKMFERLSELSREIGHRAFEFFQQRGRDFGNQLDDWFKAESEILRPTPVEITENDKMINVKAAVPGFKAEEIELSVKDKTLFMSGETKSETEKKDETTYYSELKSNKFCRQVALPGEVETDDVKAQLKDGILTIALRKTAEKEETKIAVKAA